jgi:hypothetical protein
MMEKIAGWKWAVTCDSEDPSKLSVMICHDHHAFWPLATWNVHPTWLGMAVARSWAMTFLRGHHHNRSQPPRCNQPWSEEKKLKAGAVQIFDGKCWQMLATGADWKACLDTPKWSKMLMSNRWRNQLAIPDCHWAELRKQLDLNDWQGLQRLIHFSRSTCLDGGSSVLAPISTHIS